jgi:DNA-directed RNA polymerase subunit RPC12/RpoP
MLLGPVGIAISVFILVSGWENKKREKEYLVTVEPKLGDVGVYQCSNCGTPYRLQDYRPGAPIVCSVCKKNITRPAVI